MFQKNVLNILLDSSTFNENRISVIRRVIQSTLNTAISNFSSNANYEFVMPKFTEEDWEKLVNNVTIATFHAVFPLIPESISSNINVESI